MDRCTSISRHPPNFAAAVRFQRVGGIGTVGFVAADVGPDIVGGKQHSLMAEVLEAPRSMVRRSTGLHYDAQSGSVVECTGKGDTTRAFALGDPTAGIGKGQLEDILGKVNGDAHGSRRAFIVRGVGDSMQGELLL